MILTIDVGNTNIKLTIFEGTDKKKHLVHNELTCDIIETIISEYNITGVIISDVRRIKIDYITNILKAKSITYYVLDHNAPIPFKINYNPITNLGLDRLASMAGAYTLNTEQNTNYLVIDIGTCTTLDLIVNNTFIGGNISLGLQMRLDAMHHFTHALPQVEGIIPSTELGTNTNDAIQNGAYYGLVFEINQYIKRYSNVYHPLLCIITGGGSKYLQKKDIKCTNIIFEPYLVDRGLNFIMQEWVKTMTIR